MGEAIQFETIIESGIIRIPEKYIKTIPAAVKVTLIPAIPFEAHKPETSRKK